MERKWGLWGGSRDCGEEVGAMERKWELCGGSGDCGEEVGLWQGSGRLWGGNGGLWGLRERKKEETVSELGRILTFSLLMDDTPM